MVRIGIAAMIGTWLCYDILIHSPVSIVSESIGFTSAVIAVVKHEILPRVRMAKKPAAELLICSERKSTVA